VEVATLGLLIRSLDEAVTRDHQFCARGWFAGRERDPRVQASRPRRAGWDAPVVSAPYSRYSRTTAGAVVNLLRIGFCDGNTGMPRGPRLDFARGGISHVVVRSSARWNAARSVATIPTERVFCASWRTIRHSGVRRTKLPAFAGRAEAPQCPRARRSAGLG
jgi:hypothetical protein